MKPAIVALLSCLFACACEREAVEDDAPAPGPDPAGAGADAVADMRRAIETLQAKPEKDVDRVTVRHVLVSFDGAGTGATRTKEAAEALAAEVYQRLKAGEDFATLKQQHSDDPGPPTYTMVSGQPQEAGVYARSGMVPAFGDVGWRLDVDEIGVAPFDAKKSPYGWHVIQRVE